MDLVNPDVDETYTTTMIVGDMPNPTDFPSNGHISNPPSMEMVCVKEETETSADSIVIDDDDDDEDESTGPRKSEVKNDPLATTANEELTAWFKCFKNHILKQILKSQRSLPFKKPVDAVALGIYPVYFQVIKHPMDLGTIRRRLETGKYTTKESCIEDLMLVWTNALTFNPPMHYVYNAALEFKNWCTVKLEKLERDGPAAFSMSHSKKSSHSRRSTGGHRQKREPTKRSIDHKRSVDHKRSHSASNYGKVPYRPAPLQPQPQQQHRQVSSSNNGLKACDTLLRNLLSLRHHSDFIEPFMNLEPQFKGHHPMSLNRIDRKLRNNLYKHYTEFAEDMRQMFTDTYKYNNPDSPMVTAAGKLQKEFELRFAKINFADAKPICPPLLPTGLSDEEQFSAKLQSAQNFMKKIEAELNKLVRDYHRMKRRRKQMMEEQQLRRRTVKTETTIIPSKPVVVDYPISDAVARPVAANNSEEMIKKVMPKQQQHNNPHYDSAASQHQQQQTMTSMAPYQPPPKKPRLDPPPVLTLQEANELKDEISQLHPDQQLQILDILQNNGEQLFPDEHGEVEIEISKCCAGSVKQVRAYLENLKAQIKEETAVTSTVDPLGIVPSGEGNGGAKNRSGVTSSDSDSTSDDASSSDSSDSSSDSD